MTVNKLALTREQFLAQEKASHDTIDFKRAYVDVAGDLIAGLMLSQIIYYYLPTAGTGRDKLRVYHQGEYWIAKKREDWWDECRLSPFQADRGLSILIEKGLIITKLFKFNGSPTKHLRLDWNLFLELYAEAIDPDTPEAAPSTEATQNGFSSLSKIEKLEIRETGKSNSREAENGNEGIREMNLAESSKSLTENTAQITSEITQRKLSSAPAKEQSAAQIWHAALGELQLQMTKATFDAWIKPTAARSWDSDSDPPQLVIAVRNAYAKQWLENRLRPLIERTIRHLAGRAVELKFVSQLENGEK